MKQFDEKIQNLESRLAKKGPLGGEIIGKTKSGKNIYESSSHVEHKKFSAQDHVDAASAHARMAQHFFDKIPQPTMGFHGVTHDEHKKHPNQHMVKYHHDHAYAHAKAAQNAPPHTPFEHIVPQKHPHEHGDHGSHGKHAMEGERGGKIIGFTTTSHKPIYDSANHPEHSGFSKQDHNDAILSHQMKLNHLEQDPRNKDKQHPFHMLHQNMAQKHKQGIADHQKEMQNVGKPNTYDLSQHPGWKSAKLADLEVRLAAEFAPRKGPRGGKIIGETASGKPIYDSYEHEMHKGFSDEDHANAAHVHNDRAMEALQQKNKPLMGHHAEQMKKHIEHFYHGDNHVPHQEEVNH